MKFITTKIAREKRTFSTVHLPLTFFSESGNGLHKRGFRFLNRLWSGMFGRFTSVGCFAPAKEFSNPNRKHLKSIRCGFLAALALPLLAGIALGAPTLSVSGIKRTNGNVIVSWTGNAAGPFQLLCRTNLSDDWAKLGTTTSAMSATVPANQRACFFSVTTDTVSPSTPGSLTITTNTDPSKLTLTWSPSTDNNGGTGLKDYHVFRTLGTSNFLVGKVSATRTTLVDTNLTADTTYTYTVYAADMVGNQSARISGSGRTPKGQCTYSISPTGLSIGAAATSGSVSVTAGSGCAWTASSGASWITITSGTSGNGGGTVYYSVSANTSTGVRSGTLTIAGQIYTLTQAGAPACAFSISPTSATPGAVASSGAVYATMTSGSGCNWSVSSSASWLTFSPGSGTGSAYVYWYTTANTLTTARSATLTIAGQTYTVTQAGATICSYSISPASVSVAAAGYNGTVAVTTTAGCVWTASSGYGWITITSGASGNGSGTVYYTVAANTSTTVRSGSVTIAGQTFSVSQAGAAASCSYTISPASASPASSGGSGTVTVSAGSGCSWTVSSSASWLTYSPSSGSGNGSVTWSATANTSTSSRTANLTIAGQTFTVTQAGVVSTGAGQLAWLKAQQGCTASANSVKVDRAGNVIMVGSFAGTIDFGTGPMASAGGGVGDIFVAKYSPQGAILWAKGFGSGYDDAAQSVSIDSLNNIIVTGYFDSTVNFGGVSLTSTRGIDIFVAKYRPDGTLLWAKNFGGASQDSGRAVMVDTRINSATSQAYDDILLTASFSGSATFGSTVLTCSAGTEMALIKLSSAGNLLWAKAWGDTGAGCYVLPHGLAIDRNGDAVVTGEFAPPANFGGGIIGVSNPNGLFVAKYSGADGSYRWAKGAGSAALVQGCGVAIDPITGNAIVTGTIQGTLDLGGGPVTASAASPFLAGYDPAGGCLWTKILTGSSMGGCAGAAVAVDTDGTIALSGQVNGSINCGDGQWLFTSGGSKNLFVATFSPSSGSVPPAYRWGKCLTGGGESSGNGVAFDSSGHLLMSGWFSLTKDFGGVSATGTSWGSAFVAEYTK